ncbi:MAG TPA: methyltransferase domain-containing protein [Thermoplasmata archaeon]|nr:methyltransferase domain-containing protein [Thermoplasmata archaeon]
MAKTPFDAIAPYYDLIHSRKDYDGESRFLERVMGRFLAETPKELLDVGCGTASHALILVKRGYRVTAVDYSPRMLDQARRKAGPSRPGLRLLQADMQHMALGVRFDAAYSMDGPVVSLLTTRDLLLHFKTVRDHLRPGGIYVFDFSRAAVPRGRSRGWNVHQVSPYELVELYEVSPGPRRDRSTVKDVLLVNKGSRILDRVQVLLQHHAVSIRSLRRLLARAGFRVVGFYTTGDGPFKLHRLQRGDDYPLAVARNPG